MGLIKPEMRKKRALECIWEGDWTERPRGGSAEAVPSPRDGEELGGAGR